MADGGAGALKSAGLLSPSNLTDLSPSAPVQAFAVPGSQPPPADPASAQPDPNADHAKVVDDLRQSLAKTTEGLLEQENAGAKQVSDLYGGMIPKLQSMQMPQQPQAKQTTPMQAWGSAAMVLATVGSLFTRTPLTTAMNAMAGALKGFQEGDQRAFDNNFKVWQQASSNAIAMQSFTLQAYHAAIEGITETVALGEKVSDLQEREALAKAGGVGAALGDSTIQQVIAQNGTLGLVNYVTDMATKTAELQKAHDETMTTGLTVSAFNDWRDGFVKTQGRKPTAQEQQEKWKEIQNQWFNPAKLDPTEKVRRATLLARGFGAEAFQGLPGGRSGQDIRTEISNMAGQLQQTGHLDPGTEVAAAVAEKQFQRTLATIKARTAPRYVAALKNADQVIKTSAEVPRGQVVPFNAIEFQAKKFTSDTAIGRYYAAVQSFMNEYATAINQGGQGRIFDKQEFLDRFNEAAGQKAIEGAIEQYKIELANAASATFDVGDLVAAHPNEPIGPYLLQMGSVQSEAPPVAPDSAGGGGAGWAIEPMPVQ